MRLTILFIIMTIFTLMIPLGRVSANGFTKDVCNGVKDSSICNDSSSVNPTDPITGNDGIIMKVVKVISYVIGFVAVLMIIIAGLKFVTANGNSENISSARNTILYAMIGVAIAVIAPLIVRFVISLL